MMNEYAFPASPTASGYEYDVSATGSFTHNEVMGACASGNEVATVQYLFRIGLLRPQMLCPQCAHPMTLCVNPVRWRCNRATCRRALSVRTGSVFFHSKLPLSKLVIILFYFATGVPATRVRDYVKASQKAITEWYDICRGVCSKEMIGVDLKVGGRGHVVEIDETSLAKKAKYNRGKRHDDFWVFGGFDRTSKKWFAVVTFTDRTKSLLIEVIKNTILPETHIMSDKFGSYVSTNERHTLANNKELLDMNYTHTWVNHSKHFVDPKTGAHTNGIEGCWEAKLKSKIKAMRGTVTIEQTCAIVDECMWRSWFFRPGASVEQLFKGFVTAIIKHQS